MQALSATPDTLARRARALAGRLAGAGIDCQAVPTESVAGGGGGPGVTLPSAGLSLPGCLAASLRAGPQVRRGDRPAVVGRIENGRLVLDLRSVDPAEDERLAAAVLAAAGPVS
jgi:L-seryl-tRNA(Ser) seleniumtransferase